MKRENRFVFYLLSFTWGLLWTVIGLLTALVIVIVYRKEVLVVRHQGRLRIHFKERNFGGASIGVVIITSGGFTSPRLVNHELGHTIQSARFGPLFIPLIAIPSGIRYQYRKRTKKPLKTMYDDIWFEGQATRLGSRYFN